ncbi:MAG: hypothetical protein AABN95_15965 [Acidobacteriota bacterium]
MKETTIYGDEEGFHLTVRPSFGGDGFELTVWRRNHGTAGFTVFGREKAERLAAFLYEELLPEYNHQERQQKIEVQKIMNELAARPKPKPVRVAKNAPKIDVLICPECSELIPLEDVSDERVYECGECGTSGAGDDARRCDQCNKFTAKVSETSCPECGGAMDDAEKAQAQRATDKTTLVQVEG